MGKKSVSLNSVASSPQNKAPRAASIASTTPSDLSELLAEELKKPGAAENGVVISKTHALLQEGSDNGSKKVTCGNRAFCGYFPEEVETFHRYDIVAMLLFSIPY